MYQALSVILQWEPGNEANDYCCSTLLLCVVKTALALTSVSIQPSTTLVVLLNPRLQLCIGADVSVNSALTSGYIGADVSVNSVSIQRQPQATAMHWLWHQCQFSVNLRLQLCIGADISVIQCVNSAMSYSGCVAHWRQHLAIAWGTEGQVFNA